MPELPEVESVRRSLIPSVFGRRIAAVTLLRGDYLHHEALPISALVGRRLANIRRHGKRLFWQFEPAGCLVSHLGMSGRIALTSSAEVTRRHTHVVIAFEGGIHLHFVDPRRFGGLWLHADTTDAEKMHIHGRMGVDALDLRPADLDVWDRKKARLKAELLSQKTVAGLGNIYIDEALWMARLHPLQQVFRIPRVSRGELIRCIHRVLLASLREGGTTLRDYRDVNADRGKFARRLAVYGKAGRRCRRCGATLRGMFVVQRSTVICPVCQRLRRKGANAD